MPHLDGQLRDTFNFLVQELNKNQTGIISSNFIKLFCCFLTFSFTLLTLRKKVEMLKKFTLADKILLLAAMLSLIFSEMLYFQGEKLDGVFVGLWVPSILAFGIYLKLINNKAND